MVLANLKLSSIKGLQESHIRRILVRPPLWIGGIVVLIALLIILLAIFILPFVLKKCEEQLEIFLFIMGVLAVTVAAKWDLGLVSNALSQPIMITLAVLIAGLIFRLLEKPISSNMGKAVNKIGQKAFAFAVVVLIGLVSSVITAIVAALLLVEIIEAVDLGEKNEVALVVLACYSIGFGSILTPLGGPLPTIIISKLQGPPLYANFLFIFNNLWPYLLPPILFLGVLAAIMISRGKDEGTNLKECEEENSREILIRAGKVYIFIAGLVFIGTGFKPLMDAFMTGLQPSLLYWANSVSAVIDNATLAAAEIWPTMSLAQINSALLGLTIAGGMLIPGNIPNIISACKLKIRSKQWARIGVPLGIGIMLFYFFVLVLI
jgi:predicted cation transporter